MYSTYFYTYLVVASDLSISSAQYISITWAIVSYPVAAILGAVVSWLFSWTRVSSSDYYLTYIVRN